MKTAKDRKIEKLEEALKIYSAMDFGYMCNECVKSRKVLTELTSELAALDKEIEQGDEKARCSNCDVPEALIRAASTMLRRRINR